MNEFENLNIPQEQLEEWNEAVNRVAASMGIALSEACDNFVRASRSFSNDPQIKDLLEKIER